MSADELVLQVCHAHVEAQLLHLDASQIGAEACPLEPAPEVTFLSGVTKAGELDIEPLWAELLQESPDRLRASDRHNGDALCFEISAPPRGERLDRVSVADAFDENDRTGVDA